MILVGPAVLGDGIVGCGVAYLIGIVVGAVLVDVGCAAAAVVAGVVRGAWWE